MKNKKLQSRLIAAVFGVILLTSLGYGGLQWPVVSLPLERSSYDYGHLWKGLELPKETVMVYMDERSSALLNQGDVWSRELHAKLIRRLTKDGARAVFFDVVFGGDSPTPGVDEELIAAMKENGHVFIGGGIEINRADGQYSEQIIPPAPKFRKAAAGWGLLVLRPVDADYGIRIIYTGNEQKASLVWTVAEKLGAKIPDTPEEREKVRYMHYYGPAMYLHNVSYVSAVGLPQEDQAKPVGEDLPPGYFKDKIVFIGGHVSMAKFGAGKDEFRNPWTNRTIPGTKNKGDFVPGVEVHATALTNLLHGEWLNRMPEKQELYLYIAIGVILGFAFSMLRPVLATILAAVSALAFFAVALYLMWNKYLWFAWLVPVGVQIPAGLAWSMGANYILEFRQRSMIHKAMARYVSKAVANSVADDPNFSLTPGGKIMEVTIMFTDLEGFTSMSEKLGDPARISQVLIKYFEQAATKVLENNGTLIKYIGDAVLAAWGAPVVDPKQGENAARAAIGLRLMARTQIEGLNLRTRVGLHAGPVLAGNLGSMDRIDYTVIGDAVNLASRLEGLNKYVGTDVLVTQEVRDNLPTEFFTRRVGEFLLKGKAKPVTVHELLAEKREEWPWVDAFNAGLTEYAAGHLDAAKKHFNEAKAARDGKDGPSDFYLEQIQEHSSQPLPEDWRGVVVMHDK